MRTSFIPRSGAMLPVSIHVGGLYHPIDKGIPMTSIRRLALLIAFLFVCTPGWTQQKSAADWTAWQFLQGKWVGEGSAEVGQGSGYFTFEPDLQKKVWVRRNYAEYDATKDRPRYVHEDLMIIYFDPPSNSTRAFYCDNEGHIINYQATFSSDGKALTFLSDLQEGAPRFKLTYLRDAPGHMSIKLEMAQPDKPEDFQKIVEGKVHKVFGASSDN